MTQRKTNKIKISTSRLSIQVSLNGFSFCALNDYHNTIEYLQHFSFDRKLTPNELLDKIQHAFNSEDYLKKTFSNVVVIHKNELCTLVPKALFSEDNLADYLKFNNKILSTDFITYDTIKSNDSVVVYVPYININNFLFDRFGEFIYKHYSSVLIEHLLSSEKHSEKPKMFVDVNKHDFEITVIENGRLLLYNSFEYHTKEDFIYYILFTTEQLNLNPESLELVLLGDINPDQEFYSIVYKYIRFVSFGKRNDNYKFDNAAKPKSNHSNLVILSSF